MIILLEKHLYQRISIRKLLNEYDLSSLKVKDELNPKIFGENDKMLDEVREKLLEIAKSYYEYLNVDWVDYTDIIMTGSMANYNWSEYSDIDLHIVLPFAKVSNNLDLVEDFMWTKKTFWNNEHDVKIEDYEVELYAQDTDDDLVAGGIYSVLYNRWIREPQQLDIDIDESKISKMLAYFEGKINDLFRRFKNNDTMGLDGDISNLLGDIYSFRKKSLKSGGEFSTGNLAFKMMRRLGLLDKLRDLSNDLFDDEMSLGDARSREVKPVKDKQRKEPEKKAKEPEISDAEGRYIVMGKRYKSLRQAEKVTGIPKSTLEYRIKSDNPDFSSYKEL